MIGGISGGMNAVTFAAARFDQAATNVAAVATAEADEIPTPGGLSDAMVSMAAAQFAMLASMHAARASNEMIMQAIDVMKP